MKNHLKNFAVNFGGIIFIFFGFILIYILEERFFGHCGIIFPDPDPYVSIWGCGGGSVNHFHQLIVWLPFFLSGVLAYFMIKWGKK